MQLKKLILNKEILHQLTSGNQAQIGLQIGLANELVASPVTGVTCCIATRCGCSPDGTCLGENEA